MEKSRPGFVPYRQHCVRFPVETTSTLRTITSTLRTITSTLRTITSYHGHSKLVKLAHEQYSWLIQNKPGGHPTQVLTKHQTLILPFRKVPTRTYFYLILDLI